MTLAALDHQDDQLLNAAITGASIEESFESYLDIVDAFYSEDVEMILGEDIEPLRGRGDLRARLSDFLAPIHIMAEVGGLPVSIRSTAIPALTEPAQTAGGRLPFGLHPERPGSLVGRSNVDGRKAG